MTDHVTLQDAVPTPGTLCPQSSYSIIGTLQTVCCFLFRSELRRAVPVPTLHSGQLAFILPLEVQECIQSRSILKCEDMPAL